MREAAGGGVETSVAFGILYPLPYRRVISRIYGHCFEVCVETFKVF